jgi:hypothetical protein
MKNGYGTDYDSRGAVSVEFVGEKVNVMSFEEVTRS